MAYHRSMKDRQPPEFRFGHASGGTLLIACGALGREIIDLIRLHRWDHLDVTCLPARLHHDPREIPEAVREKIRANKGKYRKLYVLYGDCGTGGLLDRVLEEEGGIERIPGPHCFSFFQGNDLFSESAEDEIGTFYLTDFFCRHFDRFVWEALGLNRRSDMVEFVFGNYERLVFMPQAEDEALEQKAKGIARRLGLEYEYRFSGYGDFERALRRL